MLTILAHISWVFGFIFVKSWSISIGFWPVNPSSEFVWRVTLIFWLSNFILEDINFPFISFRTVDEKTEIPSWSFAGESSHIL